MDKKLNEACSAQCRRWLFVVLGGAGLLLWLEEWLAAVLCLLFLVARCLPRWQSRVVADTAVASRFAVAVEAAQMLFWELHFPGGKLVYDPVTLGRLGLAGQQIGSVTELMALLHPEDLAEFQALFSRWVESPETTMDFVCRVRNAAGEYVWIQSRGQVLTLGSNGRPALVAGGSLNIHAQKTAELALQATQARMQHIFDCNPDVMLISRLSDGTITEVNRSFLQASGYEVQECVGQTALQLGLWVNPVDREKMATALRQQGHSKLETLFRLKSGREVMGAIESAMTLLNGEPHVLSSVRDVSAIYAVQQRLFLALSVAQMGVWEYDFTTDKLFWSPEIFRHFGLPEDAEASRTYLLSISHPDDVPVSQAAMELALQTHTPYHAEYRVWVKGQIVWVDDHAEIQYAADGRPLRAVGTAQDITGRKRAELALQQESEKNRALLRNASDGIHILNPEGYIVEASDSFCSMLGYRRDEIIGMHVSQWDAQFEPDAVMQLVAAQFEKAVRRQFESLHRRKDGSVFAVEVSGYPLQLAGQKVLFNSSRDISDRKQSEQALRDSEWRARETSNLLRLVSDNVTDMIWAKDLQGHYLFANKAVCEQLLHARDTEEPIGRDDLFFAARERAGRPGNPAWHTFGELCQNSDALTLKYGRPAQFEEFGNVRGKFLYLDVHKAPLLNLQGEVMGVVGSARDVTAQKAVEEKLRLAALVLENSSEAMLVTDADNRILEVNPAFSRLTGYSLQEVRGKKPSLLSSGKHTPAFYQSMWQEIHATGHWQGEISNRRKNGELYIEWLTINTIRDEHDVIQRHVALFSDITNRKISEEQIWRQANFDTLTELPNRRMFYERLAHDLKKAMRGGSRLALLFIDLDRFKEINDTLGHAVGDALLVAAARRITGCVRESDTVARLGGDEFTIILNDLHLPNSVERVADNLIVSLARPFSLGSEVGYISASIGITFYPDDATTLEDLLKNADQAMYVAKSAGRNRYAYFTNTMQEKALHRLQLQKDLRQGVLEQQFLLEYQPIVELATGRINKAEGLLRWQHPQQGRISPAEFIPLAEESGLIHNIGQWLLQEAMHSLRKLTQEYDLDFQLSLNQSPLQIQARGGRQGWVSWLQSEGLSGHNLVFEITEGLLLDTSPPVVAELMAYCDAGIQVAIDDFGTGYSSLSYLKKMHIDYIKIDQSFVRHLVEDSSSQALTEAIITMAHKLDLKVIAEGVETQAQAELLLHLGCDYAQGYWYSPSLPLPAFEAYLRAHARLLTSG